MTSTKVAVLFAWGNFTVEDKAGMHAKLHELHSMESDIIVQGAIMSNLEERPDLASPQRFVEVLGTTVRVYAESDGFEVVGVYVVADMPTDQFVDLVAPLTAIHNFPISLQPCSDLAA